MDSARVVIVVLNWNGRADTVECLDSLRSITYPSYEILVVDNGSADGSVEAFRDKYPGLEVIVNEKNFGYAEGNNIGIRRAIEKKADYIMLLNNDTVVDPSFLDELITAAEADPLVGFAGPMVYYYDYAGRKDVINFAGGKINLLTGSSRHLGLKQVDKGQFGRVREVDYVDGSCILVRADTLDKIGLLDPTFFTYWEEADWCLRGRDAGYKLLYVPTSKIWHKISASATGKSYTYYFARNQFLFMKKHVSKKRYYLFLLYYFAIRLWIMGGYMVVYKKDMSRLSPLFKGILDGLTIYNK